MSNIEVREAGRGSWGRLILRAVNAMGRIAPRLQVVFDTSTSLLADVELLDATLRLEYGPEVLGEGRIVDVPCRDGAQIVFEVPTSTQMLRYITAALHPQAITVDLKASLRGRGRYTLRAERPKGMVAMVNDPPVGEPQDFILDSGGHGLLQIPRGNWFEHVLKPTRGDQYEYLEIAIPEGLSAGAGEWKAALSRLHDAERAFAAGDDATVFLQLRGALDALPGAKKDIVAAVANENKRNALDAVLLKVGDLLHSGRHVSASGVDAGTFPVDHLDAAFALDLMRVILAHVSLILASEARRAQA